jgi:hypothetical protein
MRYIDASEAIKRLAASQGIDVLNLVKTEQMIQQDMQQAMQLQQQQALTSQAGQLAGTPLMDPSKNPEALEGLNAMIGGAGAPPQQQGEQIGADETIPPEEG